MAVVESIKSTNTDSLVLCYKRRIIEEEPNDPIQIDIEKLPDALLFEVLYRLPCRWALQYRSVSKRWCSLISHPQFVRSYIYHRHQFRKSDSDPFTLVLHYGEQFDNNILALPFYDDSGDGGGGSDGDGDGLDFLNFLPDIKHADNDNEFLSGLQASSRLNHKNVARLLGYCENSMERLLVYEHMEYDDGESESRETGRIPWRAAAQRGHKRPLCCCSERRNIDQETICENTGNPKTK